MEVRKKVTGQWWGAFIEEEGIVNSRWDESIDEEHWEKKGTSQSHFKFFRLGTQKMAPLVMHLPRKSEDLSPDPQNLIKVRHGS